MKPHPRIRKTIKWGGLAVTVLLVVVWIGSWWIEFHLGICRGPAITSAWGKFWYDGNYLVRVGDAPKTSTRTTFRSYPIFQWGFYCRWEPPVGWRVQVPYWSLTAVPGAVTALAWHLDTLARRRADLTRCPRCRYDRTGLAPGAGCPECGAAAPLTRP